MKKACQHNCHSSQDSKWAPPKHKLETLPFLPTIPISLVMQISNFLRHIYVYWDVTVLHITAVTSLNQLQVSVWDVNFISGTISTHFLGRMVTGKSYLQIPQAYVAPACNMLTYTSFKMEHPLILQIPFIFL
jgi:hypothetical protein